MTSYLKQLKTAPRPPSPDPADAWKAWKTQMAPVDATADDAEYFQDGHDQGKV